ncbi:2'-5' RNA ligase family protein [Nocardioides coralli]|uniref:2'-5' RNA ligase family protein n=1 Tax=Nocardioides coralli TaxID=2872154 RepID=UPI001CA3E0CC|nr:2'-5' RNA ligase family protein [Nocardioides coralli]QZY28199.1 2'-5' RNA ligase family protein [Nocardioides coralli]
MTRGHSVLQVPVPELDGFVRGRTAHYDPAYLSADPDLVHAHVTVLGPFLPEVDDDAATQVARVAASVPPFAFTLQRMSTFPDGIIHLLPDPADGFRQLTDGLCAAFPACRPYEGRFEPEPHLTLDLTSPSVSETSTRGALSLPVSCHADRVDLVWYEPGRCRRLRSWPLGVGAGS